MGPCVESEKNANFAYLAMRIRLCRTMKWIFAVKETPDATGITKQTLQVGKPLGIKFLIVKLVRGKSSRRTAHSERIKQRWAHRKQTYQDSVEVYSAWSDWALYVKNNVKI